MPRLKILCLHGYGQCAEIFRERITFIRKRFAKEDVADLFFIDGSVELPLTDGQSVPMRSWWNRQDGAGWPESLKAIEEASSSCGGFDGVFGFSQGGAAAALLLAISASDPQSIFRSMKFAVIAGSCLTSYFSEGLRIVSEQKPLRTPSLHMMGDGDTAVPPALSEEFAGIFEKPIIYRHSLNHCFPQRSADMETIIKFIKDVNSTEGIAPAKEAALLCGTDIPPFDRTERQADEFEALRAIFEKDMEEVSVRPPRCSISIRELGNPPPKIVVTLTAQYPDTVPVIECDLGGVLGRNRNGEKTFKMRRKLLQEAEGLLGGEMIFQLVSVFKEHLAEQKALGEAQEEADEPKKGMRGAEDAEDVDHGALIELATAEAAARSKNGLNIFRDLASRGQWSYVIGLVGKPSAGKSTFFNAASDPVDPAQAARVASFPFTTIDPNIGVGCVSTPCPSSAFGVRGCPPLGFVASGNRRVPVTIKDVAGLVPGAYQGRGKGNAFLNDLCDAHVLIHVVDASAQTDAGGTAVHEGEGSDPLQDIAWIRKEVHMWIYNNVRAKWEAIVRRPAKLMDMFCGYHARQAFALEALNRMDLTTAQLPAELPTWTPLHLHRLVAHFLRVRFPILLALNKADVPSAADHIARVAATCCEVSVPVSAQSEWTLCRLRRQGVVEYITGGSSFKTVQLPDVKLDAKLQDSMPTEASALLISDLLSSCERVFSLFGSTGVLNALDRAISLNPPLFVYPVDNLETLESLPRPTTKGSHQEMDREVLRDCMLMHPGSSVEDLYYALKRAGLLAGDYVRAEARDPGSKQRTLRKDELLQDGMTLKISVNRKVSWQHKP